jgi:hypothetical protein
MRALVLALLLLAPLGARADFKGFTSPGPLAAAHKEIEGQCDKCHVPWKGIPSASCLACHKGTARRIAEQRGPHAAYEQKGMKCSSCHRDHKGRDHELTPPVPAGFSHATTGFPLEGKHDQVKCAACHKPGPLGTPRWADLPRDCRGCHSDVHQGGLGPRCEACHAPRGWKPATKSIADHQVPMTGHHQGLTCAQCHPRGLHLSARSQCGDCHDQPHGGTKAPCDTCHNPKDWKSATFQHDFCTCILPGKHQTAPCLSCHPKFRFTPTPFACAACHKKDLKHQDLGACSRCHSALSWKQKTFDHNQPRVGFKIEGKHLEVGCENCHTQKGVFRGAPKACEGCHQVPAHGDFGACASCHFVSGWDKQSFSHDKTAFPLDGQHAQVKCQDCHDKKFKKGSFVPGKNACALCHADPHGGQFGAPAPHARLGRMGPLFAGPAHAVSPQLGCLDCHTTKSWRPSTIDVTRHASFAYALEGKHQDAPCAGCHQEGRYVGTPTACRECHVDRHRGRFTAACATCHDERGWRPVPGFDHRAATGFALTQAHDGLACAQCHGKDRRRFDGVALVGCATCHSPRHGDQFGVDCTRCHQPTRFRDVPPFDHQRTLFPLDRRHRAVKCLDCHDAQRFQRLALDCRACHGDPHRGRTLLDCGECHRADRWQVVRFDHDRSLFPLRGKHWVTPCRDCHANDQFTGVRTECISCHRGDRQRADAAHIDHRSFGFDCSECHRPFNW